MKWISVEEELPAIPLGKYGVTILVAEFDHMFEECCPGGGWAVREVMYGTVVNREGRIAEYFEGADPEKMYFFDLEGEHGPMPTGDPVYYWMYLPRPPTGVPTRQGL